MKTLEERFWEKVNKKGPIQPHMKTCCWEWAGCTNSGGYGQIYQDFVMVYASRVVWELTRGKIPKGRNVLHHCDNPPCVRPSHLFLGTYVDNMQDCFEKGRFARQIGATNGRSKLSETQVLKLRELYFSGEYPQRKLARLFKVSQQLVSKIVNYARWKHVGMCL